jgi:hypothetical protein
MMGVLAVLFALWLVVVAGLLLIWRKEARALWKEPVLSVPVLIIESDDWGAGPQEQAPALERIAGILEKYQDGNGRHPVMTIAVILAIPDGVRIRDTGCYHRIELCDSRFKPVLQALKAGAVSGVFGLQLHGMEHYWPEALMKSDDPAVREWMCREEPQLTEHLPPPLQSRWVDASELPSRSLPISAIHAAIEEEASLFAACFGQRPTVVVPTTFIWDDNVEVAWARQGVEVVITPGCRNTCRDAAGRPGCMGAAIHNLDQANGLRYLVRNDYFEPEKGHSADGAISALRRKQAQGRPCLLETHRMNFLGETAEQAFLELDRLGEKVAAEFPHIRFLSSQELATAMADPEHPLLVRSFPFRLRCWLERLRDLPRFRKLAMLTGFLPLLYLLTLRSATEKGIHS